MQKGSSGAGTWTIEAEDVNIFEASFLSGVQC